MIEYVSIILLSISLLALIVGGISIRLVLTHDEDSIESENNNMFM